MERLALAVALGYHREGDKLDRESERQREREIVDSIVEK